MLLPNFCVFCHQLQYYLFYRMKKKWNVVKQEAIKMRVQFSLSYNVLSIIQSFENAINLYFSNLPN